MANEHDTTDEIVELSSTDGVAFIQQSSPLTRLHYFDGQYLRAAAFTTEQDYHRQALQLANLAGGWGAVHGLGIALAGSQLQVTPGLAITPAGQFVLATTDMHAKLSDLLKTATAPKPDGKAAFAACPEATGPAARTTAGLQIYEITLGPVEGLCGNEPVYGKLCETACATDSRRPYWREGVVLRLRPLRLSLPASSSVQAGNVHLRNRVASAYFAAEPWLTASAVSAAGLASGVWCEPAQLYGREEVVIGLLAREGSVVRVLDAWSGRRELMDTQARGYWQGRMAMRPWNVFIAQILQFQCQLSGLFDANQPVILPADDCEQLRGLLTGARKEIETLLQRYRGSTQNILLRATGRLTVKEHQSVASDMQASFADLDGLSLQLAKAGASQGALPQQRMLLNAGFFELPPAGYLPVSLSANVEDQVRRMLGEGVNPHFHAVRDDEIPHLVEEAQHMQRISLTRGLDDPAQIEQVEVFVPDGKIVDAQAQATGTWWRLEMLSAATQALGILFAQPDAGTADGIDTRKVLDSVQTGITLDGLVRTEARRTDGSYGFALAAASDPLQSPATEDAGAAAAGKGTVKLLAARISQPAVRGRQGLYISADLSADPFTLPAGGSLSLSSEIASMSGTVASELRLTGTLTILGQRTNDAGVQERTVQLDLVIAESVPGADSRSRAAKILMLLQRDSDGSTGFLVIDDPRQDPLSSPLRLEWDTEPRRAALFVQAEDPTLALGERLLLLRVLSATAPRVAPGATAPAAKAQAAQRRQLLTLSALPAMPAPDSTIGATTMNALVALADAADDSAMLMRARRRLFPVLDAPRQQAVQAVHDWLMFRRARTQLGGPASTAPATPVLESFQIWHLKLENAKTLPALIEALDGTAAKVLTQFPFKRVGLLRYRDENAFSEEPPARVLNMWRDAQPAGLVALGRVWESAPVAGQGWQNHLRLRNMLEQIQSLTRPPLRGDGALAAIAPPGGALDDRALDGGMLVVTLPDVSSRNALLIYSKLEGKTHILGKGLPRSPMQFDDDVPQGDALKNFIASLPVRQKIRAVTLATTRAAPDGSARVRLAAVVAALEDADKLEQQPAKPDAVPLVDSDRDQLKKLGIDANDYDEVIFFGIT